MRNNFVKDLIYAIKRAENAGDPAGEEFMLPEIYSSMFPSRLIISARAFKSTEATSMARNVPGNA